MWRILAIPIVVFLASSAQAQENVTLKPGVGGFKYQAAAYVTVLTVNFFTAAFALLTGLDVIMRQPVDRE